MTAKFIVLEGPDGSGTTRQSQFLSKSLGEDRDVLTTAEPTAGPIGKAIRGMLSAKEVVDPKTIQLLFCADRAQHVVREVTPALEAGTWVVCDRYALSTIIYGAALGIDRTWLEHVNDTFIKPDLTLIALPPFEVCQERLGRRNEQDQFESRDFQKQVYDLYAAIEEDDRTIFVDTSGTKERSAAEILKHVERIF